MRYFRPLPLTAASALIAFALGSAAAEETPVPASFLPPLAVSDMLLAQATPAPVKPAVAGDTATAAQTNPAATAAPAASVAPASPEPRTAPRTRRRYGQELTQEEWAARRDAGARLQSTGFGLMMGGIGAGVGGLVLIVTALNNLETHRDAYGYETTSEPPSYFGLGVVSLVYVFPPLLTTGIILNRVGNHRRVRAEQMLDETGGARLEIAPNGFRVAYTF